MDTSIRQTQIPKKEDAKVISVVTNLYLMDTCRKIATNLPKLESKTYLW